MGKGMKKNWIGILGLIVIAEKIMAETAPEAPNDR